MRPDERRDVFRRLWDVQGGRCAVCGESMPESRWRTPHATVWKKRRPTFDHVRPVSKGGKDVESNLQLAHAQCNKRKGDAWRHRVS